MLLRATRVALTVQSLCIVFLATLLVRVAATPSPAVAALLRVTSSPNILVDCGSDIFRESSSWSKCKNCWTGGGASACPTGCCYQTLASGHWLLCEAGGCCAQVLATGRNLGVLISGDAATSAAGATCGGVGKNQDRCGVPCATRFDSGKENNCKWGVWGLPDAGTGYSGSGVRCATESEAVAAGVQQKSSTNTALIAGATAGGVVAVCVLAVLLFFFCLRKSKKKRRKELDAAEAAGAARVMRSLAPSLQQQCTTRHRLTFRGMLVCTIQLAPPSFTRKETTTLSHHRNISLPAAFPRPPPITPATAWKTSALLPRRRMTLRHLLCAEDA
jgi:hypothetical protein